MYLYFVMLCYAMLCYAMLCYAMLCYAMLCYAMLCYITLYYIIYIHYLIFILFVITFRHTFCQVVSLIVSIPQYSAFRILNPCYILIKTQTQPLMIWLEDKRR